MLRYIDNIKHKVENKTSTVGNLSLDEINRAKRLLIENEQKGFLSSNEVKTESTSNLKLVSAIFHQSFIFNQMIAL